MVWVSELCVPVLCGSEVLSGERRRIELMFDFGLCVCDPVVSDVVLSGEFNEERIEGGSCEGGFIFFDCFVSDFL